MKNSAFLLGVLALVLPGVLSAADIEVDDTTDNDGGLERRLLRISARLREGEVLVVRALRWEHGVKVMASEEIHAASDPAWKLSVAEKRMNDWHLTEPGAEQYLQGLVLRSWEKSAAGLAIDFAPAEHGAKQRYAFRWTASVERWAAAKQRHPDLPAVGARDGWPYRRVDYPVRTAAAVVR